MRCLKVQKKLNSFLDNECLEKDRLGIISHLKLCANCQKDLETFKKLSGIMGAYEPITIPDAFMDNLTAKINGLKHDDSQKESFMQKINSLLIPAGTAALIGLAVFMGTYLGKVIFVTKNGQKITETNIEQNENLYTLLVDMPENSFETLFDDFSTDEDEK